MLLTHDIKVICSVREVMIILPSSLMLVFDFYFIGGWSGSAVLFVMLQKVPAYKEQFVD